MAVKRSDEGSGPGKGPVVLHVGRFHRGKGIEVLAAAIPQVLAAVPAARFVFVGHDLPDGRGGSSLSRLDDVLRERNVRERIQLVGAVSHSELLEWYGRADIAVVPAVIYESFSYTCAQASAAKLPVVASRIGGIPETIPDHIAGLLTEPGDATQLATALIRLALDPDLRRRLGTAGQEKAVRDYDAQVVAKRFLEIYSGVR